MAAMGKQMIRLRYLARVRSDIGYPLYNQTSSPDRSIVYREREGGRK